MNDDVALLSAATWPQPAAHETKKVEAMPQLRHALIVDDNWHNRNIFRIALENTGYVTSQSENGVECLRALETRTYNLLVLDLQMPELNGQQVLKALKGDARHRDMHILVVTANSQMVTENVSDYAHFVMYKPVNVANFTSFVKRLRGE